MPDTLIPMDRQPRTEAGRALDRHKDDLRYTSWNGLPFIVAIEDEAADDLMASAIRLVDQVIFDLPIGEDVTYSRGYSAGVAAARESLREAITRAAFAEEPLDAGEQ
jgi:hypothetical protein